MCALSGPSLTAQVVCAIGVLVICFGIPNVESVSLEELAAAPDDAEGGEKYTLDDADPEDAKPPSMYETLKFGLTTTRLYMYIPIMLYNGMSLGFFLSDFTRYIIDEAIGIPCSYPLTVLVHT